MTTKTAKKGFVLPVTENQVLYTSVKRNNLRDKTKPAKYYAMVHHSARASLTTLAERLAQMSALSKGDVNSVLTNLIDVICEKLRNGNIVELGNLGNMYIGVRSKGVATAKEVTAANIKSAHIRFLAGEELKTTLKSLSYLKLDDAIAGTSGGNTTGGSTTGGSTSGGSTSGGSTDGGSTSGGSTSGGSSDGGGALKPKQ
jgi:predicted histone-like DNA-binding protein